MLLLLQSVLLLSPLLLLLVEVLLTRLTSLIDSCGTRSSLPSGVLTRMYFGVAANEDEDEDKDEDEFKAGRDGEEAETAGERAVVAPAVTAEVVDADLVDEQLDRGEPMGEDCVGDASWKRSGGIGDDFKAVDDADDKDDGDGDDNEDDDDEDTMMKD